MTNGARRARLMAATRAEILQAAWVAAREHGLAGLSMRQLAAAVDMSAPSLYLYFESKNSILDAMYVQGWREYLHVLDELDPHLDADPRAAAKQRTRAFLDFCTADPVRYELLLERTVPGFEPSSDARAVSDQVLARVRGYLSDAGITEREHLLLMTAIDTGLANQAISVEPGSGQWHGLVDAAIDMFFDYVSKPRAATGQHGQRPTSRRRPGGSRQERPGRP
jgi:AcrR family transcriptional regulator